MYEEQLPLESTGGAAGSASRWGFCYHEIDLVFGDSLW